MPPLKPCCVAPLTFAIIAVKILPTLSAKNSSPNEKWEGLPLTEDLISQIANLGFPIFVALFMLLRLENTLQKFTDTMNQLLIEFKKEKN